ncbi:MAG: hypothetical protein ABR581_01670 [Thermoleophilaceae bacterium]
MAFVAALALLFFMALDWYTSKEGEANRDTQHHLQTVPPSPESNTKQVEEEAGRAAESQERNAWQASGAIDRLALVALLAAVGLSVGAAFFRAADRRFEPPGTPSAYAAGAAALAALLVAYRIVQQPGVDETTVIKAGAPLALVAAGVVALGSARALRNEERGEAFREPAPSQPADSPPAAGEPGQERPGT